MRVVRIGEKPEKLHVRVPNAVARSGMSLEAIGLYTFLLSAPSGWHVNFRKNRPWPNGYTTTTAALRELRANDLVTDVTRHQLPDGRFDYVIGVQRKPCEQPVDNAVDNSVDNDAAVSTSPRTVNGTLRKRREDE